MTQKDLAIQLESLGYFEMATDLHSAETVAIPSPMEHLVSSLVIIRLKSFYSSFHEYTIELS